MERSGSGISRRAGGGSPGRVLNDGSVVRQDIFIPDKSGQAFCSAGPPRSPVGRGRGSGRAALRTRDLEEGTMNHVEDMLRTHPQPVQGDRAALVACIQACYDCAQTCTACADACLGEDQVQQLVRCIRLNLDCADVCAATGALLSRQTQPEWDVLRAQLQACAEACRACGAECERHAQHMDMEHCRVCADSCRRCAEACDRVLQAVAA